MISELGLRKYKIPGISCYVRKYENAQKGQIISKGHRRQVEEALTSQNWDNLNIRINNSGLYPEDKRIHEYMLT